MNHDPMIRRVVWLAAFGLLAGAYASYIAFGIDVMKAFAAGGALMFGSFTFGCWVVSKMGTAASGGVAALVTMKLPVLGLAIWALLRHFDALPVVVGGCVVMASIVMAAILDMVAPVRTEA